MWELDDDQGFDTVRVEEGEVSIHYSSGRVFTSGMGGIFDFRGSFLSLDVMDAPLLNERNRSYRAQLEDSLLKWVPEAKEPDGGLDLLMQLLCTGARFDTVGAQQRYEPRWFPVPAKHDTIYRIFVIGERAEALVDQFFYGEKILDKGQGCWITYYGHNHFSYPQRMKRDSEVIMPMGPDQTYGYTAHGVFVRRSGKESWCFISDGHILPGVERLRWPTIDTVLWDSQSATLIIQRRHHLESGVDHYRCDPELGVLKLIGRISWREEEGKWEGGLVIARLEARTVVVSPIKSPGTILRSYELDR